MTYADFADRITSFERDLAPGSETVLLGDLVAELGGTLHRVIEERGGEEAPADLVDYWLTAYQALDLGATADEIRDMEPWAAIGVARSRAAVALLIETRRLLALTLDDMAERLDVSRTAIHEWEAGRGVPRHPGMLVLALRQIRGE